MVLISNARLRVNEYFQGAILEDVTLNDVE